MNINVPFPWRFSPKLQIFVFDWDQVGKDDPLGRFSLTISKITELNPGPEPKPYWFKMTDFEGKLIEGAEVLAAFQLIEDVSKMEEKIKPIVPPTIPMTLEITTLGLRALQSTLGIHKTYLDFELPNGKRFATRQSNQPSAKNPNYLQILKNSD